jgi:DNA-binding PadR family transcriptional regulator
MRHAKLRCGPPGPLRHGLHHGPHMSPRHHRHGFGPGGWAGPWGGPREWGGPRGRRRMRRGDVRSALLLLLAEEPRTGYNLMEELENRSGGSWRPSPGSVYPALQQLEDEGLVRAEPEEGRRPYHLTDAGRKYVEENREQLGEPWKKPGEGFDAERLELRDLLGQIGAAVFQVATAGDDAQIERAKELLAETRRGLYRILAEDDLGSTGTSEDPPSDEK